MRFHDIEYLSIYTECQKKLHTLTFECLTDMRFHDIEYLSIYTECQKKLHTFTFECLTYFQNNKFNILIPKRS